MLKIADKLKAAAAGGPKYDAVAEAIAADSRAHYSYLDSARWTAPYSPGETPRPTCIGCAELIYGEIRYRYETNGVSDEKAGTLVSRCRKCDRKLHPRPKPPR